MWPYFIIFLNDIYFFRPIICQSSVIRRSVQITSNSGASHFPSCTENKLTALEKMWKQQSAHLAILSGTESATSQQNCIQRTRRSETPGTGDIHRRVEWGMKDNYEYRERHDGPWSILRDSVGIFPEGCKGNQSSARNSSQEPYEYPARVPTTALQHSMRCQQFIYFLTSTTKGLVKLLAFLAHILEVLIR
jgi:hypothetical protein